MSSGVQELRVNGVRDAAISVLDRGLQYGDGLFETIACLHGQPRFLPLHLERLEFGCERLQLPLPDLQELQAEILEISAGAARAVIKLIVTGGEAVSRGYARNAAATATRITIRYAWPDDGAAQLHDGVMVRTLTLRLGENPRLAGLKHCNRLENVLARSELAADPAFAEGLLYSSSGNLISGTASNVFLVRDGSVLTPRIDLCGVAGVMRRVVLRESRRVGVPVRECELHAQDVQDADELFLTNALTGIRPVRKLDARDLAPGPVTRHLQSVLMPSLNEQGDV